MTNEQKQRITELRRLGLSYSQIEEKTGISKNTVKTFFNRHSIDFVNKDMYCRKCGKPLIQAKGCKTKAFCSKECREKWWHLHPEMLNKKAVYTFICAECGKEFSSYGNKHRKYCSHNCYIKARFKGGKKNE